MRNHSTAYNASYIETHPVIRQLFLLRFEPSSPLGSKISSNGILGVASEFDDCLIDDCGFVHDCVVVVSETETFAVLDLRGVRFSSKRYS